MNDREFRGVLTEEIKNKYGITSKEELRLIPYLQYLLVNQMPVDPRKVEIFYLNGNRKVKSHILVIILVLVARSFGRI